MLLEHFPITISEDEVLTERDLLKNHEAGLFMNDVKSVRWLIVHCSASREDRDYTVEQMLRDHKARGFRTIGYHFYIRRNGEVTQHRHLLEVGAHCRPYNRCSIGICYEGGLDEQGRPQDTRTLAQRAALIHLLVKLKKQFPKAVIRGHNEMPGATPKACPCFKPSKELAYLNDSPYFQPQA